MTEETQEEVVPSEDGLQDEELQAESSTAETQDEEATSEQATEKEPPFHEHPDWRKFQERKEAEARLERERADRLEAKLLELTSPKKEVEAPEGATPEEREFWAKVEQKAKKVAEEVRKQEAERYEQQLKAVTNQYGKLAANQFLKDHPDIGRDSQELQDIVRKSSETGISLEDSYRVVMFDKAQEKAAEKVKAQQKAKTQQKLAAQVETKQVSPASPISEHEDDFAKVFNKVLDESGEKI